MIKALKKNLIRLLFPALISFASMPSFADIGVVSVGWGGGATHYHGGGYYPGPGPYYDRGGFYFGGGWGGPNVIINVPVETYNPPQYYVRQCDNVEVCDPYGRCWIERYCD